ncbi:hypothetical protein NBH00_24035 [Paraconexibacter antarcticus]|uniref:Uncharacterized protein n=1 Tax=Paraconexibacter antarcticus TaxID=2949664 RepID=A0ABY5DU07_9ACTN|nr:hypothetical protein [Paraconexibacter antarcticus]UTI64394.1 hypothetical protein NBH00_24035 [Paraconexibacter antarcticus]
MPPRPTTERSIAVAVIACPGKAGARYSIAHERPMAGWPCELQAIAKAMSATAKSAAPCALPWPLTIAGATVMCAVTSPGATWLTVMPSAWAAVSSARNLRTDALAISCAPAARWGPGRGSGALVLVMPSPPMLGRPTVHPTGLCQAAAGAASRKVAR